MALVGLGFLGNRAEEALAQVAEQLPRDLPTVLVLHAAVAEAIALPMGSVRGETLAALAPRPAYVALGHGHYRYAWPAEKPLAWNPGSLEYVRVDDVRQPERGFYHVTLGPAPEVGFVRTEKRPILRVRVDLTALGLAEELPEAAAAVARAARVGRARPIVQVTLTGLARFGRYRIGLDAIHEAVAQAVDALEVRIELALDGDAAGPQGEAAALDLTALRHEVLGELLRGSQVVAETAVEPVIDLIERWREDGVLERPLDRDRGDADEVAGALYGLLHPDAGDFA
jgi:DNA repair exonuclease SbcCD nuclease subunit